MTGAQQDLMYEAISTMKFGMTVTEAKKKSICIKCKQMVLFLGREYENFALCPDCRAKSSGPLEQKTHYKNRGTTCESCEECL